MLIQIYVVNTLHSLTDPLTGQNLRAINGKRKKLR